MSLELTETYEDDLDDASFIVKNRDRRAIKKAGAEKPKLTRQSEKAAEILKEAAASGVEADVFNPSFVCKFFERDWVVQYFGGFYDNNLISDVISRVKGGKEANVYVCVARPHVGPGVARRQAVSPAHVPQPEERCRYIASAVTSSAATAR